MLALILRMYAGIAPAQTPGAGSGRALMVAEWTDALDPIPDRYLEECYRMARAGHAASEGRAYPMAVTEILAVWLRDGADLIHRDRVIAGPALAAPRLAAGTPPPSVLAGAPPRTLLDLMRLWKHKTGDPASFFVLIQYARRLAQVDPDAGADEWALRLATQAAADSAPTLASILSPWIDITIATPAAHYGIGADELD